MATAMLTPTHDQTPDSQTTGNASQISPSDDALIHFIHSVRASQPSLGLPKLLAKIKVGNPTWTISEKRLRKVISSNPNLSSAPDSAAVRRGGTKKANTPGWLRPDGSLEPVSALDYGLSKEWGELVPVAEVKFVEVDTFGEWLRKSENLEKGGLDIDSKEGTGGNSSGPENGVSNGETQLKSPPASVSSRRWKGRGVVIKSSEDAELREEKGRAEGGSSSKKAVIPEGSDLWCEDAFIYSPIRQMYDAIILGNACLQCGRFLPPGARSISSLACSHFPSIASRSKAQQSSGSCHLRYCSRSCHDVSKSQYGPFVCINRNSALKTLFDFAYPRMDPGAEWKGIVAVWKVWSRILLAWEKSKDAAKVEMTVHRTLSEKIAPSVPAQDGGAAGANVVPEEIALVIRQRWETLAVVGEKERRIGMDGPGADARYAPRWKAGYDLLIDALLLSRNPSSVLQRELPPWLTTADYFSYDSFLEQLGRVSLNQEDDGGVYLLHACINHSCSPSAVVRRSPAPGSSYPSLSHIPRPSRVYVRATRDLQAGDEVTISYCPTNLDRAERQKYLKANYCFECGCERCVKENELMETPANFQDEGGLQHEGRSRDGVRDRRPSEKQDGLGNELMAALGL